MLAAPIRPSAAFNTPHDLSQFRPAKDLEAFNALLPPPIEFVEGSSSGSLAIGEGKYQPINGMSTHSRPEVSEPKAHPQLSPSPAKSAKHSSAPAATTTSKALYPHHIDVSWPQNATKGCGLVNTGNTCFLNSALQCLLHTPPLLHVLYRHSQSDPCPIPKNSFCMTCSVRQLMMDCYNSNRPMVPYVITTKLQHIAKHLRRGRQEDSHEFLRYAIDALQKSCLASYPSKIDHKLAETTWVHRIFGGRLRSRVTCLSCHYNSDTFDSMLDLSVDIYGVNTLRDALRKFVAIDHLKGADKYKCEKCKKHVTANKQFTVHEAPMVLTVHLKRFSPMGRKIGHPVKYEERLSLQPIMSEGQYGPTYSLFGIISHAGGGPNSGHYFAHIKDSSGQWYEMNDETVVRTSGIPLGTKNAYMLFYIREKGQALEAAVAPSSKAITVPQNPGTPNAKRRRRVDSDEEDDDAPPAAPKRFIGPLLPPQLTAERKAQADSDPQAELLKRKIAEKHQSNSAPASPTKPSAALQSLSQYADDDEDDDMGEKVEEPPEPTTSKASAPVPKPTTSAASVSVSSFYGASTIKAAMKGKKRKSPEPEEQEDTPGGNGRQSFGHSAGSPRKLIGKRFAGNPYSRLSGGNNLRGSSSAMVPHRFGKKHNTNRGSFNRRRF